MAANKQRKGSARCPVCKGSGRAPAKDSIDTLFKTYDKKTNTIACLNCGGQYQYGSPVGKVPITEDMRACLHDYKKRYEYDKTDVGRILKIHYNCKKCGDFYIVEY